MMLRKAIHQTFGLAALVALSPNAHATDPVIGVDGCAILAIVVHTAVAGDDGRAGGGLLHDRRSNEITICNQTARAVSMGFSGAMWQAGIDVTWSSPGGSAAEYCTHGDLVTCRPRLGAVSPARSRDSEYVECVWRDIAATIHRTMHYATVNDTIVFRAAALHRSLGSAMRESRLRPVPEYRLH